jgi:hypothetical protein
MENSPPWSRLSRHMLQKQRLRSSRKMVFASVRGSSARLEHRARFIAKLLWMLERCVLPSYSTISLTQLTISLELTCKVNQTQKTETLQRRQLNGTL